MTLDELRLLEKLVTDYRITHIHSAYALSIEEKEKARWIIERDIKMKTVDPRIFAKDRKDV